MKSVAGSPQALAFGAAIRRARKIAIERSGDKKRFSLRAVAARMNARYPELSEWENGWKFPPPEKLSDFLEAVEADSDTTSFVLEHFQHVTETNWVTAGFSQAVASLIHCERTASLIVDWMPLMIPGLLQTSEYARNIVKSEAAIDLRLARRDVLTKPDPVNLVALIGESALTAPFGGVETHLNQLRHLLQMSEMDNVTIYVVPARQDKWHPGLIGPFIYFDFPSSPPIVHLEHHRASVFIHNESDVVEYRNAIDAMRSNAAMDVTPSKAFIAGLIEKMEKERNESPQPAR